MLNRVTLIGNVGGQIDFKEKHVSFSLATSRRWQDKTSGEWKTETEWHRCVVFGSRMKICKRILKGDQLFIEGSLRSSTYEKNGEKRSSISIVVENIILLTKRTKSVINEGTNGDLDLDIFEPVDKIDDDREEIPF